MKKTLSVIMALVMALSAFTVMAFAADEKTITEDMFILKTGADKESAATFALGERVYGKVEGTQAACYKFYVDAEKEVTFNFDTSAKLDVTVERHGNTENHTFTVEESGTKKISLESAYYFITIKNFINTDADLGEIVSNSEGEGEGETAVATEYKFSAVCDGLHKEVYGTLNKQEASLAAGDSLQLMFTMHPDSIVKDLNCFWRVVEDPATEAKETDVATVDKDGLVTINMNNNSFVTDTTIKVQAVMYYGTDVETTKTCTIKVTAANIYLEPYYDTTDAYQLKLGVGAYRSVVAKSNVEDRALIWTSDNESVATVNDAGKITATGVGETIVTVTIEGTSVKRRIAVVVEDNYTSVMGIAFKEHTATVRANEDIALEYSFQTSPADRTPSNSKVTFTSSNPEIATVDVDGKVTGVAEGTATITVKSDDGSYTDECVVTVTRGIPNWLMVIIAPIRMIYNLILLIIGD